MQMKSLLFITQQTVLPRAGRAPHDSPYPVFLRQQVCLGSTDALVMTLAPTLALCFFSNGQRSDLSYPSGPAGTRQTQVGKCV